MADWKFTAVAGRCFMRNYDCAGRLKVEFVMEMNTSRREQYGESYMREQRKHAELSKSSLHSEALTTW